MNISVRTSIIPLESLDLWPASLLDFLNAHENLFRNWYTDPRPQGTSAAAFDTAVYRLREVLQPFSIVGWHCTRLTDYEIADILANGLQLPDAALLEGRIQRLLRDGVLTPSLATAFAASNGAGLKYRAGMVWFCFFPPRLAGESGIGRFFRYWGGEALYVYHESTVEHAAVLSRIGSPCLVEAEVPIAALEPDGGLDLKIIRRFLRNRGHLDSEPLDHEDRIKEPLRREFVRRIIRHPEQDFLTLTGCENFELPLE